MPQTLQTPAMKEIVVDATSGGVWATMTPWQVSRTGVNVRTLGGIDNSISIIETSSPILIVIIGTAPSCGLNLIQEVGDIWQSNPPVLVRQYQKLDAAVDGKLSDNHNCTSILSKVISDKLTESFRRISTYAVA